MVVVRVMVLVSVGGYKGCLCCCFLEGEMWPGGERETVSSESEREEVVGVTLLVTRKNKCGVQVLC